MPRREGEVFRFGTAIEISPEMAPAPPGRSPKTHFRRRAYRGSVRVAPAQRARFPSPPDAVPCGRSRRPRLVNPGKPPHARTGPPRAAQARVWQDRGEQRGLAGIEVAGRLAEGVPGRGLGAEFAVRAPLGDVEIDFHQAALAEHPVEP